MITKLKDIRENKSNVIDFAAQVIDEDDANDLADALKVNTSAKQLLLNLSNLLDNEFIIICGGLLAHPGIDSINISNNELSDMSIPYIEKLIRNKKTLKLNIMGNKFSEDSIKSLEKAIQETNNIVSLERDLPDKQKPSNEVTKPFFQKNKLDLKKTPEKETSPSTRKPIKGC